MTSINEKGYQILIDTYPGRRKTDRPLANYNVYTSKGKMKAAKEEYGKRYVRENRTQSDYPIDLMESFRFNF